MSENSSSPFESALRNASGRTKRGNSYALPLLPILLSAILGCMSFAVFPCGERFSSLSFLAASVCAAAAFSLKVFFYWSKKSKFHIVKICVCAAFFFGFFGYCAEVSNKNPYPYFTGMHACVRVRIDEVSTGKNDSRYGVGTIVVPPDKFPLLKGVRVWFLVGDGKKSKSANREFVRSQIVSLNGVIQPVRANAKSSEWASENENKAREFERYLARRFVFFKISSSIADSQIVSPANSFYEFFNSLNKRLQASLDVFLFKFQRNSEAARTYYAMLLGDKSKLTQIQKDSFSQTGTMHVFAISGLHVGFAAALLYFAVKLLRFARIAQPLLALPILFAYVQACGGRPSAMRAFVMVAVFWLALAFGRGIKPWGALLLSALGTLIFSPLSLFDAGFALSYGVVASIFVYGLPLAKYFEMRFDSAYPISLDGSLSTFKLFRFFVVWGGGAFAISLGAFFAGAPLCAYYFSYIAPAAPVYSPVFVLLAGWVVFCGFGAFLLPHFIGAFFNSFAWFAVWIMSNMAQAGNSALSLSFDFPLESGAVCVASLASFLGLSAALEHSGAALRFVLPAAVCFAILCL